MSTFCSSDAGNPGVIAHPVRGSVLMQCVDPDASVHQASELIRRARARDSRAWSTLYNEYYPLLYRYAYARLHSPEEAEDIAAQVFVEALRGIDRFEERGRPILAWLYRIAHNLVVERIRRENLARRVEAAAAPRFHPASDLAIESLDLFEAVGRLKREQQDVIILRFFLQMTSKEVASVIRKSEPAVQSLQARAVAALKRRLLTPPEPAPSRRPLASVLRVGADHRGGTPVALMEPRRSACE